MEEGEFGLLERNSPDLCADRVDYSLREFKYWLNPKIVKECVEGLLNLNGEIVFNDKKRAFNFAANYLDLQTRHWGGYEAVLRYQIFSDVLKYALGKKAISKKDFFEEESQIVFKLTRLKDSYVQGKLLLLKNKSLSSLKKKQGKIIYKKFRFTDPKILNKGNLIRLSGLDLSYAKLLQKHRKINEKGIIIAF